MPKVRRADVRHRDSAVPDGVKADALDQANMASGETGPTRQRPMAPLPDGDTGHLTSEGHRSSPS